MSEAIKYFKQQNQPTATTQSGFRAVKSGDQSEQPRPSKKLEPFENLLSQKTQFFSTTCPDSIEKAIIEHLNTAAVKPTIKHLKTNKDKYKLKLSLSLKNQSGG